MRLVALNSHSAKPMIYKVAGTWGNHEGSMMLWMLILTLFGAMVAWGGAGLPTLHFFHETGFPLECAETLKTALGLEALWTLVRRQSGHIDRLCRLHLPEAGNIASVLAQHEQIAATIARREPSAARTAVREHLNDLLGRIDEIRRLYPESVIG